MTLVLDSEFPVVVGEKAWDALRLTVDWPYETRAASSAPWALVKVEAGVSPSIVPREAIARLRWSVADRAGFENRSQGLVPSCRRGGVSLRGERLLR